MILEFLIRLSSTARNPIGSRFLVHVWAAASFLVFNEVGTAGQPDHYLVKFNGGNSNHFGPRETPLENGLIMFAENYWEAVGLLASLRTGIDPAVVRRPLPHSIVMRRDFKLATEVCTGLVKEPT